MAKTAQKQEEVKAIPIQLGHLHGCTFCHKEFYHDEPACEHRGLYWFDCEDHKDSIVFTTPRRRKHYTVRMRKLVETFGRDLMPHSIVGLIPVELPSPEPKKESPAVNFMNMAATVLGIPEPALEKIVANESIVDLYGKLTEDPYPKDGLENLALNMEEPSEDIAELPTNDPFVGDL